jgi:ArsR family transcriptional regulator, arsenate/arsenite/antimonite-responsive transcriptional repressor
LRLFDISNIIEISNHNHSFHRMDTQTALPALAALAHESRLAIFRLLVQAGPHGMAASKISEQLNIAPSSLSFHLKELAHADLLVSRQEGRFVIYSAQFSTMNALSAFMSDNCCGGNPCMPVPQCTAERKATRESQ